MTEYERRESTEHSAFFEHDLDLYLSPSDESPTFYRTDWEDALLPRRPSLTDDDTFFDDLDADIHFQSLDKAETKRDNTAEAIPRATNNVFNAAKSRTRAKQKDSEAKRKKTKRDQIFKAISSATNNVSDSVEFWIRPIEQDEVSEKKKEKEKKKKKIPLRIRKMEIELVQRRLPRFPSHTDLSEPSFYPLPSSKKKKKRKGKSIPSEKQEPKTKSTPSEKQELKMKSVTSDKQKKKRKSSASKKKKSKSKKKSPKKKKERKKKSSPPEELSGEDGTSESEATNQSLDTEVDSGRSRVESNHLVLPETRENIETDLEVNDGMHANDPKGVSETALGGDADCTRGGGIRGIHGYNRSSGWISYYESGGQGKETDPNALGKELVNEGGIRGIHGYNRSSGWVS
eukprot:CAMPEP_0197181488 /NCGR_PEP_ID=MMETSP1423-20130617/5759_1 /TAXON_ID=476441 /ORGANISM="Pseudo-nitzschia heimii, Strain UNC1101" /LENGTH=400 /DNA_ID=CAMNT_0042631745 /DNA_START=44 /DNA_END=1243 /DNA_ORIENTATION=+